MGPPGLPGMKGGFGGVAKDLGPKSKTKPFFWEVVGGGGASVGGTIWAEAGNLEVGVKFEELEDLFENATREGKVNSAIAEVKPEIL